MNDIIQNMMARRSIRKYKPEQIKDEELELILQAGAYAPSGKGAQPVHLVVIQDKAAIAQLSKMNADIMGTTSDPFYGAPTVIVVLADKARPTFCEDGSLVLGNLMNAAHSVGVDSCWIHRARQEFDSDEGKALLKKWGIAGDYAGIGHCILGYHDGNYPSAAPRKKDFVTYVK